MYIFGGRAGPECPFNDLYSLDRSWKWIKILFNNNPEDIPRGRWRHTTNVVGHHVILFGGRNKDTVFNDTFVLNLETMVWTEIKSEGEIPAPRYSHSAGKYFLFNQNQMICFSVVFKEQLFVFGGIMDTFTLLNDIHVFDIKSSTWRKLETTTPPSPRFSHTR